MKKHNKWWSGARLEGSRNTCQDISFKAQANLSMRVSSCAIATSYASPK